MRILFILCPAHSRACVIALLLCGLLAWPLAAQDDTGLAYGATFTGRLDNNNPRAVYFFEGLRGDVIAINLRVTDGDLDPVLTVLDNRGGLIKTMDDHKGSRVPSIAALTLPHTDRYYVVVGRFGYALGTTSGGYELNIERISVSSASGSQLRYGDSIINRISDMEPQLYYTFQAQRGDIVSIRMRRVSGDLDSYLQVVQVRNGNAFVIADNDDLPGTLDSGIDGLLIEEDDTYVIIASRYGQASGTTSGNFVLSLSITDSSDLGTSLQAAFPLRLDDSLEGVITPAQPIRYYRLQAQADDLITLRMERLSGGLDPALVLLNDAFQELARADAAGSAAQIADYRVPADGTYYIMAMRRDGAAGVTAGTYRLQTQHAGNIAEALPADVPVLRYGTTITGYIDSSTPEVLYAFWGREGDTITVSMNRADGNLDPVVSILNSDQRPVVSDDDSGGNQNALIAEYRIPASGIYYIRARRYTGDSGDPNTFGSYILVLAQRFN